MAETAVRSDRLRVVLADPDPIARRALRSGFDEAEDFVVIAETGDGVEAAALTMHYRPDVAMLAVNLPGVDGAGACARVHGKAAEVPVLLLAASPDPEHELAALRAGAAGLLGKDAGIDGIVAAARAASAGELTVSPAATRLLVERMRAQPEHGLGMRPVRSPLTTREWEVLDLLTVGRSTHEIASELFLSEETVQSHVKSILRKLKVHSRAEAVARGTELRWPSTIAA